MFRTNDVMVRCLCSAIAEQRAAQNGPTPDRQPRKALVNNFDDGFEVQRAVEAAFQSSRKGRWVRLDEVFNPALEDQSSMP